MSHVFPSTRYQGSKAKLSNWIWTHLAGLDFHTCLDAFGGTGAVAYRLKQAGKSVTYNDVLRFNYYVGLALIENAQVTLDLDTVDWLLTRHADIRYPTFIQDTFGDIYFTAAENAWLDQTITNLRHLENPYQYALAFFALSQACIIKRPYNLFHRKNLYLRFAEVDRSFGNKTTWDKPFAAWFRVFAMEANHAVFDNGQPNRATCADAATLPQPYDLVYLDPPYISSRGKAVDYRDFYHFLEGLTMYDTWSQAIDYRSRHHRLRRHGSPWTDKRDIYQAFEALFARYHESIIVVSYRTDGIPTEQELVSLLRQYRPCVRVEHFGKYQYALSTNRRTGEMLIIGSKE